MIGLGITGEFLRDIRAELTVIHVRGKGLAEPDLDPLDVDTRKRPAAAGDRGAGDCGGPVFGALEGDEDEPVGGAGFAGAEGRGGGEVMH